MAAREDEDSSSESSSSSSSPPSDHEEKPYLAYKSWWKTASADEAARVERLVHPEPNAVVLSQNFPCPKCKAVTPQAYASTKNTDNWIMSYDADYHDTPPGIGRLMQCFVCDTYWAHHVEFKGYPTGPRYLSKVRPTPKKRPRSEPNDKPDEEDDLARPEKKAKIDKPD
jgi:hypothetical protein